MNLLDWFWRALCCINIHNWLYSNKESCKDEPDQIYKQQRWCLLCCKRQWVKTYVMQDTQGQCLESRYFPYVRKIPRNGKMKQVAGNIRDVTRGEESTELSVGGYGWEGKIILHGNTADDIVKGNSLVVTFEGGQCGPATKSDV